MRLVTRRRALFMVAVLLLMGATIAEVVAERNPSGPPLSSRDASASGALALARWLESLGYSVQRLEDATGPQVGDILFVLRPIRRFDRPEADGLLTWVRRGGVLVYAPSVGSFFGATGANAGAGDGLTDALEVTATFFTYTERATAALPFFTAPPAREFLVRTGQRLDTRGDAWVPLIEADGRPIMATRQLGDGRVYAVASTSLLSNEGIAALDNEALVLNILARHPARRAVSFEEYHHTLIEKPDLATTMRTSPWGWAVQYAALVAFCFLLWGGRRFGPPVFAVRTAARSGGDYIVSFAGLLQKARAVDWVQQQYAGLLRRRLARFLGVRHDLPAIDLARLLAERWPVDEATLAEHLVAFDGRALGQRALLRRVREVEQLLWAVEHGMARGPARPL